MSNRIVTGPSFTRCTCMVAPFAGNHFGKPGPASLLKPDEQGFGARGLQGLGKTRTTALAAIGVERELWHDHQVSRDIEKG